MRTRSGDRPGGRTLSIGRRTELIYEEVTKPRPPPPAQAQ